jgi:protein TonB
MLRYPIRQDATDGADVPVAISALALLGSVILHVGLFVAILHVAALPVKAIRDEVITVTLIPSQQAIVPTSLPTRPEPPPQPARHSPAPLSDKGTVTQDTVALHPADTARSSDATVRRKSKSHVANPAQNPAYSSHAEIGTQFAMRANQDVDNAALAAASPYMELLARKLAAVKRYPAAAIAQREEGVVLLSFQLDRSGELISWRIAATSGHRDLDEEVGRMVSAAAPFPPFPESRKDASGTFVVPVTFSLR